MAHFTFISILNIFNKQFPIQVVWFWGRSIFKIIRKWSQKFRKRFPLLNIFQGNLNGTKTGFWFHEDRSGDIRE
jgi:hypothetical protein